MSRSQQWILFLIICTLFLLIGIAALLTVLGFYPAADPSFRQFAVAVLFTDIAGAVVTAFRFSFIPARRVISVNLAFAGKRPTQLTPRSGAFAAFDLLLKPLATGAQRISKDKAGWVGKFELSSNSVDHIQLTVTDSAGRKWNSLSVPLDELDATLS